MPEEDSGVPDGPVSPCGHRNRPNAHFCDACGVRLPMPCPCCSVINRVQANFCSNCGMELRDVLRTHAAPSVVPFRSSTHSSPRLESQSALAAREPFLPVKQAANGGMDGPDPDDSVPSTRGRGKDLLAEEDAQHLRQIARFAQQRRRRASVWLGTVSVSIVIGLLGAALVRTHTATPTAEPRPFIDTDAQGRIATTARESVSAASVQRPSASAGPPDTTIRPTGDTGSPAPATLEGSPGVARPIPEPAAS